MLGQCRRRWTRIGPVLGQRLVFANTKHLYNICTMLVQRRRWEGVLHIAGCKNNKTVALLIEPKDDLATVDHLPGSNS